MRSGGETVGHVTDRNRNGYIDQEDFNSAVPENYTGDVTFEDNRYTGRINSVEERQRLIDQLRLPRAADNIEPSDARTRLESASSESASLVRNVRELEARLAQMREDGASRQEIRRAEADLRAAQSRLSEHIMNLQQLSQSARLPESDFITPEMRRLAGLPEENGFRAQTVNPQQAGATGQPRAQTVANQAQTGFTPPGNWGAQFVSQDPTAAFVNSSMMENNIMNSWNDAISTNQQQGKKLMMLFFQLARMAQSGDLGAMYQFMKLITYIISKDKANQQIEMGKKLIELQNLSREWTNKLLDMQQDANDPNASTEFMKLMTEVKAETDAIATSQKLISQMMEEFAQVVETLTNTTKAALDAEGRVLRSLRPG